MPAILRPIRILGIADLALVMTAAQTTSCPAVVVSAPEAAGFAGVGWFKALIETGHHCFPTVPLTAILDCGDMPGLVLAAWRVGVSDVIFSGDIATRDRLCQAGAASGGVIHDRFATVLDLAGIIARDSACRTWLTGITEGSRDGT
ncbi:MAG: hypothetical protein P4M00_10705 [Azospirillaceae bacterium]|nr:hypothetical protein [Azospirillaceae bacterium]